MHSDLAALIKLQSIDARINELLRDQEGFPASLAQYEGAINKARAMVENLTKKFDALQQEKLTLEGAISDAKSHLDKSQDLLNTIKTNREYDAVHTQIENFKNVVSSSDVKIKKFDQDAGELKLSIEKAKEELEKTLGENEQKIIDIKTKMDAIGASVAEITLERNAILVAVPKTLLRTYEHILKRRKTGQVLSYVTPDDRTCSVCYKILEAQLVNEIRKSEKVIVCQNCGSIFVWKDYEKPASA
jgi:uncharacterized protein